MENLLFDTKCALPQERIIFLKTRLGAYRAKFSYKNRTQGEKSVSEIGFMLIDPKIHSK